MRPPPSIALLGSRGVRGSWVGRESPQGEPKWYLWKRARRGSPVDDRPSPDKLHHSAQLTKCLIDIEVKFHLNLYTNTMSFKYSLFHFLWSNENNKTFIKSLYYIIYLYQLNIRTPWINTIAEFNLFQLKTYNLFITYSYIEYKYQYISHHL